MEDKQSLLEFVNKPQTSLCHSIVAKPSPAEVRDSKTRWKRPIDLGLPFGDVPDMSEFSPAETSMGYWEQIEFSKSFLTAETLKSLVSVIFLHDYYFWRDKLSSTFSVVERVHNN